VQRTLFPITDPDPAAGGPAERFQQAVCPTAICAPRQEPEGASNTGQGIVKRWTRHSR